MKHLKTHFAPALALLLSLSTLAQAEDLRPSYECLPETTVAAVRVHDPEKTVEAFRTNTRLGQVFFAPDRIARAIDLFKAQDPEQWEELQEKLGELGLEPGDLLDMYAGEMGFAVSTVPNEDSSIHIAMYIWSEPGAEASNKLITAIDRAMETADEDDSVPTRTDLEMAGQDVILLTDTDEPINFFIAPIGDRFIAMLTAYVPGPGADETDADFEAITDHAAADMARFIAAHLGDAEGETFAQRILETPGMAASLADGQPILEFYIDVRPMMSIADQIQLPDQDMDQIKKVINTLGLDSLSTMGTRMTLDGQVLRSSSFIAATAPRRGLMKLLDQPAFQPGVPNWVPAAVVDYTHMSIDGAAAWELAQEVMIEIGGEQAQAFIDQQIEMNVQGFAQEDLATVLAGLGNRVHVLTFAAPMDFSGEDRTANIGITDTSRIAIAWQLENEPLWERLMMGFTGLSMMSQGAIVPTEEQGFTGLRLGEKTNADGGLVIGKGYLVLGIGKNVLTPVLSALSSPPEGPGALANSDAYQMVRDAVDAKPGIAYQFTDSQRYMTVMYDSFRNGFEMQLEYKSDEDRERFTQWIELMPTRDEFLSSFGPASGQSYVNEHGMFSEGFIILPPAE